MKLHWQIVLALVLAVGAGAGLGEAVVFGLPIIGIYDFVATLFLNALKMLIVPLVASSIISGIAGLGTVKGFGRLGLKTIGYYMMTSLIAIVIGLVLVDLIRPGAGSGLRDTITANEQAAVEKVQQVADRGAGDVAGVFLRLIPTNVIQSAAQGDLLGLIFFSLLFGYFVTRLPGPLLGTMASLWEGLYAVMLMITDLVMKFSPIGVFALVAKVFATTGLAAFGEVAVFFVTVLAALALHIFVVMPLLLLVLGRVHPLRHFQAMAPALLAAFSTASSSATLPLTIDCVQKRARVSRRVTSFVLPLGATINMDGTALYECVAAIFIAQALGVELTFAQQFTVVMLALLTSIGVAGIPQASLVAILVIMKAVGLPDTAIGILFATDRLLDMCRTSVNIFSDSCGAVIIARSEGEEGILPPMNPGEAEA